MTVKAEPAEAARARDGGDQAGLIRQLEVERARLVAAQAVAKVGSWETDFDSLEVTWSAETYRIFGTTPDRFQPSHEGFLDLVHLEDRATVAAAFARSAGLHEPQTIEHRVAMADGRIKHVVERWQAFFDAEGRPRRAIGTCQDISTERLAEEAIRLQARMLDSIGQAVIATDVAGRITYANLFAEQLYGWATGDMLGRNISDVTVAETTPDQAREIMGRLRQGQSWSGELQVRRRDGTAFPALVVNSPILDPRGSLVGIIGISTDATERRAAAAAVQASVDEFRSLADAMPQIVWVTRPDGWNTWVNQQFMNYTGLSRDQSVGDGWRQAFHPEDQQRAWDSWQVAVVTGGDYTFESRVRRADGVYRWWLIRGAPLRDESGALLKWIGTCTDIHDLKVAQVEISAAKERFAKVFHSDLMIISIAEIASGRLIDVNDRCAAFFGYRRDEMVGRTVLDLGLWVDTADREQLIAARTESGAVSTEARFRCRSGEIRHALVSLEALTLEGVAEPLIMTVLVDLTDRRHLEAQLLQAQKMEAVGRLAGGVAHDFNNSLGVILGYTELLLRQADARQKGKLEQIQKATERAAGLTRQLLAFSRKQVVDPKVLDLNLLLADLQTMLGRLIGEDIDLAMVPGEALGQVKADAGQLEQVVMNLCVNARDAMPDGGLLRIETSNVEIDAAQASRLESTAPGRYVMLAVSDAGCGIAAGALSQIFEPFFTTKEAGKGTGLGLAMVYGIVKQAGGHVAVDSVVGKGTSFRVYLPRFDEAVTAGVVDEVPLPDRGWETILLVEDEEALRAITQEILSEHGYRVLEAAGADQAIEIVRGHPEPIHLVLTDVIMPGTNGRALALALAAVRPEIKVLFMSGYTDDVIAHRGVLEPGTLLLEKPFTVLALLRHVRSALGTWTPKGTA